MDECRLDGYAPVFVAFAAYLQDRTVGCLSDVGDVGAHQFIGAQPASRAVRMRARSRSIQSPDRCGSGSTSRADSRAVTASAGNALGSVLAVLGGPISGIGFAAINSAVYRKVHSTFQVDQQRRMDAASWDSAYRANAARSASVVMSATVIDATPASPTTTQMAPHSEPARSTHDENRIAHTPRKCLASITFRTR